MNMQKTMDQIKKVKLSFGDRWMIFNHPVEVWEVYERKSRQHYARLITQTEDIEFALIHLVNGSEL